MTTAASTSSTPSTGDGSVILYSWPLLTANPDGAPASIPEWADRTWQAAGTWGGAVLTFQGSNDGANWFPLTNAAGGTAATLSANGGLATIELPLYTRPNLSTVGSGASLTVTCLMRRATPLRT